MSSPAGSSGSYCARESSNDQGSLVWIWIGNASASRDSCKAVLTRGKDEFGDEVHGVVPIASQIEVLRWASLAELLVQLAPPINVSLNAFPRCRFTYLSQVQTRTVSTVVVVPVHVENLLSINGEQSGEDTFRQAGALFRPVS